MVELTAKNAKGSKERPILFNGEMVRAVLDGRKTQTRRPVTHDLAKPPYFFTGRTEESLGYPASEGHMWFELSYCGNEGSTSFIRSPWGVGDLLWVRETWAHVPKTAYAGSEGVTQVLDPTDEYMAAVFRADWGRSAPGRWKPSIHMPKWASRIKLRVKRVWVERVQDISEADANAEGVKPVWVDPCIESYADGFLETWDSVYGNWSANPWVWCCEFERVESSSNG